MIIQILLRLLSTPKPTMNAQLFPSDGLDKMRLWNKILRPDCCRRLILNHKSHYNILLRIQIDIRNAAEAVLMQKQRAGRGLRVSVSRSELWVGCRDDTQCYRQPCSSLHLSHPQLWLLLGWCSKARYQWDNLSFSYAQRSRRVCQKWELQFSCPHPSQFQILSLNIFSRWFSWGKTGWDLQALADDGNPWPWLQTPS